LKEKTLRCT